MPSLGKKVLRTGELQHRCTETSRVGERVCSDTAEAIPALFTNNTRGTQMANASQLKALIQSHAEGDDERFYAVALQVAAESARQGHARSAQTLRETIDQSRLRARIVPGSRPPRPDVPGSLRGELSTLLVSSSPSARLADMCLVEGVRVRLERVLLEQRRRGEIQSHGLSPLRRLLLVGPPGTGKTLTAAVLAGELGLPLFAIQLDALITRYLGETAAKLRLIFDAARETRGVYLFDEFDALGGDRSARNEVGEIRRVLNSFLQFLEWDDSGSLLVAATNHPDLLDRALFRRFDTVIEYGLPTPEIALAVMRGRLAVLDTSRVDWEVIGGAARGLCHADLTRACEQAAKDAILSRRNYVETRELVEALQDRATVAEHRSLVEE